MIGALYRAKLDKHPQMRYASIIRGIDSVVECGRGSPPTGGNAWIVIPF